MKKSNFDLEVQLLVLEPIHHHLIKILSCLKEKKKLFDS